MVASHTLGEFGVARLMPSSASVRIERLGEEDPCAGTGGNGAALVGDRLNVHRAGTRRRATGLRPPPGRGRRSARALGGDPVQRQTPLGVAPVGGAVMRGAPLSAAMSPPGAWQRPQQALSAQRQTWQEERREERPALPLHAREQRSRRSAHRRREAGGAAPPAHARPPTCQMAHAGSTYVTTPPVVRQGSRVGQAGPARDL